MGPLGRPRVAVYTRRVRIARKAAGLTVRALAFVLHIPAKEYRRYEHDVPLPIDLIGPFCAATRCSPVYLLTGEGEDGGADAVSTLRPVHIPPSPR